MRTVGHWLTVTRKSKQNMCRLSGHSDKAASMEKSLSSTIWKKNLLQFVVKMKLEIQSWSSRWVKKKFTEDWLGSSPKYQRIQFVKYKNQMDDSVNNKIHKTLTYSEKNLEPRGQICHPWCSSVAVGCRYLIPGWGTLSPTPVMLPNHMPNTAMIP